jgi:hypothetical protein
VGPSPPALTVGGGAEVLRFLLWRVLGLLAVFAGLGLIGWFLAGGLGRALRGSRPTSGSKVPSDGLAGALMGAPGLLQHEVHAIGALAMSAELAPGRLFVAALLVLAIVVMVARWRARRGRRYVRLRIDVYRGDRASAEAVVAMYGALHKRLLRRWWRRLFMGQPSVALEVHHTCAEAGGTVHAAQSTSARVPGGRRAWLAVSCPQGLEAMVESALQTGYPNCRLSPVSDPLGTPPVVLRLKKHAGFIKRVKVLDHFEHERDPPTNRLITVMGACDQPAFVQLAMTPAPALFERLARHMYKRHELHLARERREHLVVRDRSMVDETELRGGLQVQHRPLFFTDLRIVAPDRSVCERIASELRAEGAENRLVERGTGVRHGLFGVYERRVRRGEGNPLPSCSKGVFASTELAAIWQMPSTDYMTVPFARASLPLAPAPPAILRPGAGRGMLRDAFGPVSIHEQLRKQNTAVPGAVEQGKSSYLVATVAEDLLRERCALILLDPKGDAAEAALSLVPVERACTLLDFSRPTCGFNPLAADAQADVIADYVVAALKHLFTDADIRASSDRYLRNAIIAVLAYDRNSTLWDAARLLSVGEEGYSYRRSVGSRIRTLPAFKEISAFFTDELTAQLADARSTTTAKLDAPVNKLARLLNSQSIKRVLLNDSLRVDFDRVIANGEVLVVKGALGGMGAGNTSVLMQLLVGMLDAALARQQDLVPAGERVSVALKVDEAPLVINRGFAETMALKRSAGLETVACWQTDAQWTDREVRDQLDALFAHRVYFATASARDARSAVQLTMAEFSDTVRPGVGSLSALGHPDVRLRLPRHHAIVSWITHEGRQPPFVAETIPLQIDRERLAQHAARQLERGGQHLADLRQPHWERVRPEVAAGGGPADGTEVEEPEPTSPATPPATPPRREPSSARLPASAAESYRELADLDAAHSVRWADRTGPIRSLKPDRLDFEMLSLIANLGHVLTSQIHRRFNAGRAVTTTQRRLKRLWDAGLLERFQFHRRDGGGVPMCYVVSAAGVELLSTSERPGTEDCADGESRTGAGLHSGSERRLRRARREVHAAGWALALERALADTAPRIRGPGASVLSPPLRSTPDGRVAIGPADLRLPAGRTAHDFLRFDAAGGSGEVGRFDTLRPDAVVEVPGSGQGGAQPGDRGVTGDVQTTPASAIDVMVEFDDRIPSGRAAEKLVRYDHFLAGWSAHTKRYGQRLEARPVIVFVCRDRARARECARRSDTVLRACRAYAGEYPFDWEYPGRESVLFVSERDVHEGLLCAYGVQRLPPEVRVTATHGDLRAAEATAELRNIISA